MKKFEELKSNSLFSVGVWELKPSFKNEEFMSKYVFNAYVQGLKFSFMKTGDKTCVELTTGTEFTLEKLSMTNEEIGLHFFGSYVNDASLKNIAGKEFILDYFETAKKINQSGKKLIRK